jgi:hypothetical protein
MSQKRKKRPFADGGANGSCTPLCCPSHSVPVGPEGARSAHPRATVNQTGPVHVREASTRERPDGLRRGMFVVGAPSMPPVAAIGESVISYFVSEPSNLSTGSEKEN